MSEMIDGYTAKLIKDFWASPALSSYSHHSFCQEYARVLEKEIERLLAERDAYRNGWANEHHYEYSIGDINDTKQAFDFVDAEAARILGEKK